MSHRGAIACVLAIALLVGGCAIDEPSGVEPRSARFPDDLKIDVSWQNTVIDILPISRFRDPPRGTDSAEFTTTLILSKDVTDEQREFLEGLRNVDVDFEQSRVARLRYQTLVKSVDENGDLKEETNRYEVTLTAPIEFAELSKNGDVNVIVLLPRGAERHDDSPSYEVKLVETEGEPKPAVAQAKDASQRTTVAWYARVDPPWSTVYEYVHL